MATDTPSVAMEEALFQPADGASLCCGVSEVMMDDAVRL
jgi:hypothetical protein